MLSPFITGFALGFSLILAIGAQNAFVLRQGLARSHVFWLVLFCATSDALLVSAGVLGFGAIVGRFPQLPQIMAWAGAIFLFAYGALRFWSAWKGDYAMQLSGKSAALWPTLATAAAFTWLNPHVYLDTVGLIGAVSTQYLEWEPRLIYGLGAILASYVFFFSLGYGARYLSPVMRSADSWRRLDVLIGAIMWMLAIKLVT